MRQTWMTVVMAGLLLVLFAASPSHAQIEGQPDVLDGVTLRIAGQIIRLHGIDAPDRGQICERQNAGNERVAYDCGFEATNALGFMTVNQWVQCRDAAPRGANGEMVAKCVLGGRYDIGEKMVRQGWALPSGAGVAEYGDAAAAAQKSRNGLWAGDFKTPWDWRAERR